MNPATHITINPYFKCNEGKLAEFKALLPQFVEKTATEPACHYYGFTISGDVIFCREGYEGAEGLLAHLGNVGPLLEQGLAISELIRLEVHGPEAELAKLREPLADLNPDWFVHECSVEK